MNETEFLDAMREAQLKAVTCRHGFTQPAYEVSRSFVDDDGIRRWYRKLVTDEGGCPDAPRA